MESEEAAEAVETVEEGRGLGGRLASLIGRDLGDRQDDAAERPEPPLESVPMPRIEPGDRAAHAGAAPGRGQARSRRRRKPATQAAPALRARTCASCKPR